MTREQALNYLKSSGFSEEQIQEIVEALEQEPTTKNDDLSLIRTWGLDEEIRCTMCTNSMKSDRGCDGNCVVNKGMYKAVMDAIEKRIQPTTKNDLSSGLENASPFIDWNNCHTSEQLDSLATTKNDLVVDAISRVKAIEEADKLTLETGYDNEKVIEMLNDLPSVTPQEQEPRWISVSKQLPEESTAVLVWCPERKNIYCAYYEEKQWWIFGAYWEKITLDIIAWMPLPKAYSEVEK